MPSWRGGWAQADTASAAGLSALGTPSPRSTLVGLREAHEADQTHIDRKDPGCHHRATQDD
jgi:hypothetical protein